MTGLPLPDNPMSDAELRAALEQTGRRYTRQRAGVFAYLRSVDSHPTAEQVFAAVRRDIPNLSLATVYNALDALVEAGLVTRLAGHRAGECGASVRYDGNAHPHYHLRCERTGQVRDLPLPYAADLLDRLAPELAEQLRGQGFEVLGHRLEIVGRFHDRSLDSPNINAL